MNVLCITKCPTGMVQTYMAAERLEKTAKDLGYTIHVETHGNKEIENRFTPEQIDAADYVLIAADTVVGENIRFGNKKIAVVSLQDAIAKSKNVLESLSELALPYEEAKYTHKKIFG